MLNCIVLIGRLTRDPETRRTASGQSITSFTLAVDDPYRGPNGEKTTLFMSCVVFGNKADVVAKFVRKGSLVSVQGRLTSRKFVDRNNVERTVYDVRCDQVEFLDPKNANNQQSASVAQPAPANDFTQPEPEEGNFDGTDLVDDDLPF